jgi:hypothetical protein
MKGEELVAALRKKEGSKRGGASGSRQIFDLTFYHIHRRRFITMNIDPDAANPSSTAPSSTGA